MVEHASRSEIRPKQMQQQQQTFCYYSQPSLVPGRKELPEHLKLLNLMYTERLKGNNPCWLVYKCSEVQCSNQQFPALVNFSKPL